MNAIKAQIHIRVNYGGAKVDIIDIKTYKGRNIYSSKPVIKAVVDIGDMWDTPTCSIDGFNERLIEMLPGLCKHYCSLGYEGGFLERLNEGTYLAHVAEHMILELQSTIGYDVHYGRSREIKKPSLYYLVFEFKNEKFAVECLLSAVEIVNLLIENQMPDIKAIMNNLEKAAAETCMGPSTSAIFEEALRRKIPVTCLDHSGILQLGYGKYTHFTEASLTDNPSCITVDIAGNKQLTKQMLSEEGIPVPPGDIAYTVKSAVSAASHIGYPVVIKPFDANQGKGVFLNISNDAELEKVFHSAVKYSRAVIVEKYIPGRDYRLLIVGGKMVAAAERNPPEIVGDGVNTVKQLVEMENMNPERGSDHEKPLTKIKLDDMSRQVLLKEGFDENSIPEEGRRVKLRYNGNISTGGTARDCTEEVHPCNIEIAINAAKLLKLDIAGVDITCTDISKPIVSGNGAVIEANAAPGLRMHLHPSQGQPHNVAGDILDFIYPEGTPFSIPLVSVTGTNGKTTVTRLIAHTIGMDGTNVGMACTSGIYLNKECISKGDNTGAISAAKLLRDKRIEAAVLETARGGMIKKGLGYDNADVGVIINLSEDHLGIDGINTLEEMAKVKSLVVEAVKPDGYAVLNANDEMTRYFLERTKCRPVLFSTNYRIPLLAEQIERGEKAVYVRDGSVFSFDNGIETFIVRIDEVPITLKGKSECNIENSVAAASALLALGISTEKIKAGLISFKSDISSNPGRFNIFDVGGINVMLDYGHNTVGYRAVVNTLRSFDTSSFTGVIGMPGDRSDKCIDEAGRICGSFFTRLYIKEDNDLRGRNAGEVADILYNAAIREGMCAASVNIIYQETKAFETAIMEAQPGDMVVLFFEELEPALEVIEKCRKLIELRSRVVKKSGEKESRNAAG